MKRQSSQKKNPLILPSPLNEMPSEGEDKLLHYSKDSAFEFDGQNNSPPQWLPYALALLTHEAQGNPALKKHGQSDDGETPLIPMITDLINQLDFSLASTLDRVLHHEQFQRAESLWRGAFALLQHVEASSACHVDCLNVTQEDLNHDFAAFESVEHSGLYRQVFEQEYNTPGGVPYGAMVAHFHYDHSPAHMAQLRSIAQVAEKAHCPFIANVDPRFFKKESYGEVAALEGLSHRLAGAEYLPWRTLRKQPESRYLGLTFSGVILRKPYGIHDHSTTTHGLSSPGDHSFQFHYRETVSGATTQSLLWGGASMVFAQNLIRSFQETGWTLSLRGLKGGGKSDPLPLFITEADGQATMPCPAAAMISESTELALSELGFIPLCYIKNTDYGCFFSANSVHEPTHSSSSELTANSRLNARLPYVFLSSRIAHHLKLFQREQIGSDTPPSEMEQAMNQWLKQLVTKMPNPESQLLTRHPLREGKIAISTVKNNPGFYSMQMHMVPHFQIEGFDVHLSLVTDIPAKKLH